MKNEKAIATVEAIEQALTAAKWALKRYTPELEKNVELSKKNRELDKKLKQVKSELAREKRIFELYKKDLALCPACGGDGGFEIDYGPEGGVDFEECPECKCSGAIPLVYAILKKQAK